MMIHSYKLSFSSLKLNTLGKRTSVNVRQFSTQRKGKIYSSADEAVADIKDGSKL